MSITGWVSNLTKNTASARMHFAVETTDEAVETATLTALLEELTYRGRAAEAKPELWTLKAPIEREYPECGKTSARIRFVRVR